MSIPDSTSNLRANPGTLLQFNATIIVGILLFLTLSEGYFNFSSNPESHTNQTSTKDIPGEIPPLQISFTFGMIIPFAFSCIALLADYNNSLGLQTYKVRTLKFALQVTIFGIIYIMIVLIYLIIIRLL
ncbi:MAG: hypothetical protein ACRD8W_09830 [Nitrososphaeraceae archaeon]